ncbi:GGDEF domain-containing protein [Shewanella sp. Scap07]|uniref:GGDEF domain-containing protein n=1 Tax=Shewanella sp. Scap07 TaxID=2589987 RepID=UPI003562F382|nr:GGDEF domain-containing protein [Shewanella sp. Scap07]
MNLTTIVNWGTQQQPFSSANRIRMTNIIGLITVLISLLYSANFFLIIGNYAVGFINLIFTLAYFITNILNGYNRRKTARIWFFSLLMLHLWVCTNIYVTNESGFHLYYFLVPTGAFLLFELKERREQIILSGLAIILFFVCENTPNNAPLIHLTDEMNRLLYQSVVLFTMLEVIVVLYLFAKQIDHQEQRLIKQASTDSLTKLANRHCFFDEGKALFSQSRQNSRPFSLVLVDLDFFKNINDKYGHPIGDKCLIGVTDTLRSLCREQDLCARIGGEEFVIAMPNTSLSDAQKAAERMRREIALQRIPISDSESLGCTASFGIANNQSEDAELRDLLIQADKALYLAKESGRNCVKVGCNQAA